MKTAARMSTTVEKVVIIVRVTVGHGGRSRRHRHRDDDAAFDASGHAWRGAAPPGRAVRHAAAAIAAQAVSL